MQASFFEWPKCMSDLDSQIGCHLITGADVTHPRGFTVTEPSVAAVVGSLDSNTARYAARIRLQGHRIKIIQAWVITCRPACVRVLSFDTLLLGEHAAPGSALRQFVVRM